MAVDSTGKVYTLAANSTNVLVNRYNANGTPDGSFGQGGQAKFANDGMNVVKIALRSRMERFSCRVRPPIISSGGDYGDRLHTKSSA